MEYNIKGNITYLKKEILHMLLYQKELTKVDPLKYSNQQSMLVLCELFI